MCRVERFEFGAWTESPGDSAGGDSGIGGSLHVHSGVSHVEYVFTGYPGYVQNVMHHCRVRLHVDSFPLSEDGGKTDVRKIVCNQFHGGGLIFVGGYGEHHPFCLQLLQQLGDAGVGAALVGIVQVVIGDEFLADAQDVFFTLSPSGRARSNNLLIPLPTMKL